MLEPHTAAELTLDEVSRLVVELLLAHGDWIPALSFQRDPAKGPLGR